MDKKKIEDILEEKGSKKDVKEALGWLATNEGIDYLSERMDKDIANLTEELALKWTNHNIPEERMKTRLLNSIQAKKRWNIKPWLAAAVLFPFMALVYSLWFVADRSGLLSSEEIAEMRVPYGEQVQVVLQDGSLVHLNSGSVLKYPKRFALFNRKVELKGEGYFQIVKDKDRPFSVDLNGVSVTVTGTQFNVKAYPKESSVLVTLKEGGVYIADTQNKKYHLTPGETATYNRETGSCAITKVEELSDFVGWREKKLNFERTPLKDIIRVLERQYNVEFIVPDSSLLENRFTLSTDKMSIDNLLLDLEMVSHTRFILEKEGVYRIQKK